MDIMYAQVEQANAVQDYPPFKPCVRLVGVEKADFENEAFNEQQGCRTHFIDIAWGHLFELAIRGAMAEPFFDVSPLMGILHSTLDWPDRVWVRIDYVRTPSITEAYYYEIFGDEDPQNISVKSIKVVTGPAVQPAPLATTRPMIGTPQTFGLLAFHVGQGMCALLRGQHDGVLLDAGAGVPLRRKTYRQWLTSPASVAFASDLRTHSLGLRLQAIISHPDSDHWRLLDWDSQLFSATTYIYTPAGSAALALKSSRSIGKVYSLAGTTTVTNGPRGATLLEVHRSSPSVSDRNGECLVIATHTGVHSEQLCLFPGDYVYDRMAADGVPAIVALSSAKLDAVMVPHHGDAASASVLVSPISLGRTVAFFSAGTHIGYGHPTAASISAHTGARFLSIDRHTCADIVEHPLP